MDDLWRHLNDEIRSVSEATKTLRAARDDLAVWRAGASVRLRYEQQCREESAALLAKIFKHGYSANTDGPEVDRLAKWNKMLTKC